MMDKSKIHVSPVSTARNNHGDHKDSMHDVAYDHYGRRLASCSIDQSGIQCLETYRQKLFEKLTRPPQPQTVQEVEDRFRSLFPSDRRSALRDSVLRDSALERAHCILEEQQIVSSQHGSNSTNSFPHYGGATTMLSQLADKVRSFVVLKDRPSDNEVDRFRIALLDFIFEDFIKLVRRYVTNLKRNTITREDINVIMHADEELIHIFKNDDSDQISNLNNNSSIFHNNLLSVKTNCSDSISLCGTSRNSNRSSRSHSEIIKDMVHSEKLFLRDLKLIMKVFRDKLYPNQDPQKSDINKIFSNILEIYELSTSLLTSLEEAIEDDEPPYIGSSILELALGNKFDAYCTFASEIMSPEWHQSFSSTLSDPDKRTSIRFAGQRMLDSLNLTDTLSPDLFDLSVEYVLPKLLVGVIFHFFEYFRSIQDLQQQSSEHENDQLIYNTLSILLSTKGKLEVMLTQNKIDKTGKPGETFLRLPRPNHSIVIPEIEELKRNVENWDSIRDNQLTNQEFLIEGDLIKAQGGQKRSQRHVFLFDGLLFFCKKNPRRPAPNINLAIQGEYKFKEQISLKDLEVFDYSTDNLKISHSPQEFSDGNGSSQAFSFHSPSFSSISASNGFSTFSGSILSSTSPSSLSSLHHPLPPAGPPPPSPDIFNLIHNSDIGSHAFKILKRDKREHLSTSIILFANSAEEKAMWLSNLVLLLTRSTFERALDRILKAEKASLPLPPPKIYRFTEPDSEQNIIFENKEAKSSNKANQIPIIRCATLLKLVERLTFHKFPDPTLVKTFLTTYRSFVDHPLELLDLLIERFNIPEPYQVYLEPDQIHTGTLEFCWHIGENLSTCSNLDMPNACHPRCIRKHYANTSIEIPEQIETAYREAFKRFRDDYSSPVKVRVINVLRSWVQQHFYDFERYPSLLDRLQSFLDEVNKSHPKMRKFIESINNTIVKKQKPAEPEKKKIFDKSPPELEWHTANPNDIRSYNILSLHPVEIARQITLIGFDLFKSIKQSELIYAKELAGERTVDEKKYESSPNKSKFENHFNKISYWVRKCIIEAEDFDHRVKVIERALQIMLILDEQLNNFAGFISIGGAIECSSVKRLKLHFKHVQSQNQKSQNQKYQVNPMKAIEIYDHLFDKGHFKGLQKRLKEVNPPCLPFLGYYQTQLIHTTEGNRTFVDERSTSGSTRTSVGDRSLNTEDVSCASAPVSPRSPFNRPTNALSDHDFFPTSASLESFNANENNHHSNEDSTKIINANNLQTVTNKPNAEKPKMINFTKQRIRAAIIAEIGQYQNQPYNLTVHPLIREWIESIDVYPTDMPIQNFNSDEELYNSIDKHLYDLSRRIEPGTSSKPPPRREKNKIPPSWISPYGIKSRRSHPTALPPISDRVPSAHHSPSTPLTPQTPPLSGGSAVSSEHSVFASAFASPTLFGSTFEGSVTTISTMQSTTSVGTIIENELNNNNSNGKDFIEALPPPPLPPRGKKISTCVGSSATPPKPTRPPPLPPPAT